MSLRDRCKTFLDKLKMDAMLRQNSPVDDLVAFVLSETGKAAEPSLEDALPLCLYFGSDADRDNFIQAFREAKPHVRTRKI